MTQWKALEMSRPEGEADYITIIDCFEGDVYYKFFVDGNWKHDTHQESVRKSSDAGLEKTTIHASNRLVV
jgi:hypothetical protein